LVILFFVKSTRLPLLISFVWFIALFVGYTIVDKRKQAQDKKIFIPNQKACLDHLI
jgi:AAT family amino acid transporter